MSSCSARKRIWKSASGICACTVFSLHDPGGFILKPCETWCRSMPVQMNPLNRNSGTLIPLPSGSHLIQHLFESLVLSPVGHWAANSFPQQFHRANTSHERVSTPNPTLLKAVASRLEAIAISNKKLLGAPGLTTRSVRTLLGAPGIATSSKDATRMEDFWQQSGRCHRRTVPRRGVHRGRMDRNGSEKQGY